MQLATRMLSNHVFEGKIEHGTKAALTLVLCDEIEWIVTGRDLTFSCFDKSEDTIV